MGQNTHWNDQPYALKVETNFKHIVAPNLLHINM